MSDDDILLDRLRGTMPSIFAMRDAAAVIERLRAEVERQTNNADTWREKANALETERDALKADAERYRWLRNRLQAKPVHAMSGSVRPALVVHIGRAYFDSTFKPLKTDDEDAANLDAAIDAARGKT